ncbi:MAG: hypothetical protein AAFX85_18525, partial [Pseudomonadota bacterium]
MATDGTTTITHFRQISARTAVVRTALAGKLAGMQLCFDKMEGCGNDFVVLDRLAWPEQPLPEPGLVRHLSDRRRGVGCDQLLVLE